MHWRLLAIDRTVANGYRRSRAYLRGHSTTWMRQRGLELCALADLAPRPITRPTAAP